MFHFMLNKKHMILWSLVLLMLIVWWQPSVFQGTLMNDSELHFSGFVSCEHLQKVFDTFKGENFGLILSLNKPFAVPSSLTSCLHTKVAPALRASPWPHLDSLEQFHIPKTHACMMLSASPLLELPEPEERGVPLGRLLRQRWCGNGQEFCDEWWNLNKDADYTDIVLWAVMFTWFPAACRSAPL